MADLEWHLIEFFDAGDPRVVGCMEAIENACEGSKVQHAALAAEVLAQFLMDAPDPSHAAQIFLFFVEKRIEQMSECPCCQGETPAH